MTLLELADRVEAATGPDRFLDKEVHRLVHGAPELSEPASYGWREDEYGWWFATGEDARTPPKRISPAPVTSSLDAAMTLADSEAVLVLLSAIDACQEDSVSEWVKALPRYVTAAALRARTA